VNWITQFRLGWLIEKLRREDPYDPYERQKAAEALGSLRRPEALRDLGFALKDREPRVRQAAAEALGNIGGAAAANILITALPNDNWDVQEKTREALVKIGRPAVEPLIDVLKNDRDRDNRRSAAMILGKIAEPTAVEPLIDALQDKEITVRETVIEALGNMAAARAVEPLIRLLEDKLSYTQIRETAAVALGKIGDPNAVPPLLKIITNEYPLDQAKAAAALDNLGWKPANNSQLALYLVAKREWNRLPPLGKDAVETLLNSLEHKGRKHYGGIITALAMLKDDRVFPTIIQALSGHHDAYVRREAAEALGKIGDARVVVPLLNALKDKEREVQAAAKKALLNDVFDNIKDDGKVMVLVSYGLGDDWSVKGVALEILEKMGKSALLPLIHILEHGPGYAQEYAARLLGNIRDPRVIGPLIRALQDYSPDVRREAVIALGKIGNKQATVPLITALEDKERLVRWRAVEALATIRDSKAIPFLITALKDEETIRKAAVRALGKIVRPNTAKPLIDALKDENYFVTDTISRLLGQILGRQTAAPLVQALKETHKEVRQGAANILTQIGWEPANNDERALYLIAKQDWDRLPPLAKDAVEPLIHILEDKDFDVRWHAIIALGQIKDDRTINTLAAIIGNCDFDNRLQVIAVKTLENGGDKRAVPPLVDALKHNKEQDVRQAAAKALGKIKDPGAITPLIEALKDENYHVQIAAVTALGEIGHNRAVEPLLHLFEEKEISHLVVLEALNKIGDPRAKQPALLALTDKYYHNREEAAKLLDKIGWEPSNNNEQIRYLTAKREWDQLPGVIRDEVDTTPFIIALEDRTYDREGLITALGKMGKPWAEDIFLPLLEEGSPDRETAARALAKAGDPRAVAPLTHLMKNPIPNNRCKVVDCLGEIGAPAVEPLIEALKDESYFVRISAVQALGKIKDPRAVVPLIQALKDKDFNVREKTVEALAELADPRAVVTLVHLLEDRQDENTTRALQKMSSKLPAQGHMLFCITCCSRAEKYRLKLSTMARLEYYACRNCHQSIDFIQGISRIILLLDRSSKDREDKEVSARHEETLIIDWFKKKAPVDFDEIRIEDAEDFEVEELVMMLKNDPDDKRRKHLPKIPVYLSPNLKLSRAKMNMLNDNFKITVED
jgi:HEAT repeat protein